jgi:uncharacterized protein
MRKHRVDPEGTRLPIKLDSTCNGEFLPVPLNPAAKHANALAHERVSVAARRAGLSRRGFLVSTCGAAATLAAMNEGFAGAGRSGGYFAVAAEAAFEPELAAAQLGGNEFIFDVQGHHVNPKGAWRSPLSFWNLALRTFPQARCDAAGRPLLGSIDCFGADHFINEIFFDSDTDLCVLSSVPSAPEDNPLSLEDAAGTRAIVDALEGDFRLLIHGLVHPQLPGAIDGMAAQLEQHQIAAWKTYTQWGPDRKGFWLYDEQFGIPMIEQARALGVNVICIHKGLPLPGILFDSSYAGSQDIGIVARMYPDVTFIVYHSGYEPSRPEGPYAPDTAPLTGVDILIKSLEDNGIAPNSNVYAELGSTWRHVMKDPQEAAHLMGKLLKHVGEDRVLWGTDSIWYGSPQDQIQAFRAFRISEAFQERYGYPAMTTDVRAKVFGLSAARGPYRLDPDEIRKRTAGDRIEQAKAACAADPDPSYLTYGPRSRREFLRLLEITGGRPA